MDENKIKKINAVVIVFLITGYLGMIIFSYFGIQRYRKEKDSLNWPQVDGIITLSKMNERIVRDDAGESKVWEPLISYEYVVKAEKFIGSDIGGPMRPNAHPKYAQEVINSYPKGKTVSVFYNPAQPEMALLLPGISGETKVLLFFAGVALFEVCLMHMIRFYLRKKYSMVL